MKPIFENNCNCGHCDGCMFYEESFYIDKDDRNRPFLVEEFSCERFNDKIVIKNVNCIL